MQTYTRSAARIASAAFVLIVGATAIAYSAVRLAQPGIAEISLGGEAAAAAEANPDGYTYRRYTDPPRTEISDRSGKRIAVMTDGARTGHLAGPVRVFAEPRFTNAKIENDTYVRMAPQEWRAGAEKEPWFTAWFAAALTDPKPDLLATALEYTYGAPPRKDDKGVQFSGDAAFGPLSDIDPDGRAENSDFYDYLGMSWTFPDGVKEKPSPTHLYSLDCSGFVRMVYGYRMGYPLRGANQPGGGLPRQAHAIASMGPGVLLMPNTGKRARELERLLPGDMLFFNAGPVQGANIEHMGIYLGVDDRGHQRFISSRSQANGPTMGDLAGESVLDGTGYWALRWRTARRV